MMDVIEESNGQRVSTKQREVMVSFMREHSALATGRFTTVDGAKNRARLTKEFGECLNAVANGATKSPEKWMKCWQDWKSDVKKKASKIKRHASGTGGGPPCRLQLTQLEEDLIAIMGAVAVTGQDVTDPLDAQRSLIQERLGSSSPAVSQSSADSSESQGIALESIPTNEWLNTAIIPLNNSTVPSSACLPSSSAQLSESSELNSEPDRPRKRKKSEGGTALSASQETMVRNADNVARQVEVKNKRLDFEMKRFEKEMELKEKELEVSAKVAEAATASASAMNSMAMAVTAAMQAGFNATCRNNDEGPRTMTVTMS